VTNAEKLERIVTWQGAPFVPSLTCGVDSGHRDLVGREMDGEVMLICPDCGYVQKRIPGIVFSDYAARLGEALKHAGW
jgi:hypothetical protein